MTVVLEKVQRLERYVQAANGQVDEIVESTIDKLLGRERQRLLSQLGRLESQALAFENRYGWSSDEFYPRFERGELGDAMDFIEWSATVEMIQNLRGRVASIG